MTPIRGPTAYRIGALSLHDALPVCLRAGVAVIARAAISLCRIGAGARLRIASPRAMTLIRGRTDYRIGADATRSEERRVVRAGVAVIARAAISLSRIGAGARLRIARPRAMSLIRGGIDYGIVADAPACVAGVCLRAGVAVIARAAISLCRIGAGARLRIASPRAMTLIRGRTDYRIGADAT